MCSDQRLIESNYTVQKYSFYATKKKSRKKRIEDVKKSQTHTNTMNVEYWKLGKLTDAHWHECFVCEFSTGEENQSNFPISE